MMPALLALLLGVAAAEPPDWTQGDAFLRRIAELPAMCPPPADRGAADKALYDELGAWAAPHWQSEDRAVRVQARMLGLRGLQMLVARMQDGDACCLDCYEAALWTLDRRGFALEQALYEDVSEAHRVEEAGAAALCELLNPDIVNPLRMGCRAKLSGERAPVPDAEPVAVPAMLKMSP